eukprot:1367250-Amorphochlora_amoeboformis.AAC.1
MYIDLFSIFDFDFSLVLLSGSNNQNILVHDPLLLPSSLWAQALRRSGILRRGHLSTSRSHNLDHINIGNIT